MSATAPAPRPLLVVGDVLLDRDVEGSVERLEGVRGMRGQQVTRTLKAEHQALKAL